MFSNKTKSGTAESIGSDTDNNRILLLVADEYLKERKARRRWGILFKLLILAYISTTTWLWFQTADSPATESHTALVEIDGVIGPDAVSASQVNESLAEAFASGNAKGVIIRINSPGGTPVQAAQINEEIWRLRNLYPDKPVYAAITDMCTSGGYYIAVAADQIYAHPSSIVGSIGVVINGFGFVDSLDKLGVDRRLLTAGENKAMLDPFSPVDPVQQRHVQKMLDEIHLQFIDAVKTGRGERIGPDPELFSGLIWSGEKALELGLVDGFGSSEQIAREMIGEEHIVDYTYRPSFLEQFANQVGVSISRTLLQSNLIPQ